MSELAFNANGETFEVPANVSGWRVRRMKPRGAPELVYGRDGRPLVISIDSDMDDLRDAVATVGKYRLDPVNEDGRTVENVPAAYVQVVKPTTDTTTPTQAPRDGHDDPVREAMRLNTELARAVIDRFPEMMTAAAELLRAADGAGLPSRQARLVEGDSDDDETDDETTPPGGFDLNAFVGQLVPVLMAGVANGKLKMPGVAAMLDWRKATPAIEAESSESSEAAEETTPQAARNAKAKAKASTAKAKQVELPPLDPSMMAHFVAIQSQLTAEESAFAREVAQELEPAELRQWFDEPGKLSVAEAVAKIRSLINKKTTGGAS